MRIWKVIGVVAKSVAKRAGLDGVLKIPDITIWLFELKGQVKVEYVTIMLLLKGAKILH